MRRCIFIVFLLIFLFNPSLIFAQEKNSSQYYQDLLNNYRVYQTLIEPFNTAKTRHQTYNSVSTQADLLKASQNLVSSEIEAILSYTLFIKTYLAEATKVINYHENYLYIRLDDEIAFLNVSKNRIKTFTSLEEINSLTKDLTTHYQTVSQVGYQVKAIIQLGSVNKVWDNVKIDKDKISNLLSEVSSDEAKLLQVNAGKNQFNDIDKEVTAVEELLTKAEGAQKTEVHDDQKGISNQINQLVGQAVEKISNILGIYKNIVLSLK